MGFTGIFWWDIHMVWRWVLLAAGLAVIIKAVLGWLGNKPWSKLDDQLGMLYTIAVDVQFLLGLILWFTGPFRLLNAGNLMSDPKGRFMVIEHPFLMLVALILAHIGRSRSRKADSDVKKHRTAFIFYLLSFLFIVLIFVLRVSLG